MISRIKAIKSTFQLVLTVSELIIAAIFILKMFSSGGELTSIFEDLGSFVEWSSSSSSAFADNNELAGPAAFLLTILGFMIFAFILITVAPRIVEKRERESGLRGFDIE